MALSNIFNEPRREITESVIGMLGGAILSSPLIAGGIFGFHHMPGDRWFGSFVGAAIALLGFLGLYLILDLTHDLGEDICAKLKTRGLDPRPVRESEVRAAEREAESIRSYEEMVRKQREAIQSRLATLNSAAAQQAAAQGWTAQ